MSLTIGTLAILVVFGLDGILVVFLVVFGLDGILVVFCLDEGCCLEGLEDADEVALRRLLVCRSDIFLKNCTTF